MKTIHCLYDDDEVILEAAKKITSSGIKIKEVFSPFPIHGIDPVIGLKRTRIAVCAFLFGLTGATAGTLMMWYMMIHDWPTNIGGKPTWAYFYNVPAFIPPTFECTVFCAAHLMFLTFLLRSWILPGVMPKNPDPRTTDDKFLMLIETDEKNMDKIVALVRQTGASEVSVK